MNKFRLMMTVTVGVALAAAFFSCKHGLGEAIDLNGPVLTIIKPAFMQSVSDSGIEIEGFVQDDSAVASLVIKMEGTSKEWRNFHGEWQERTGDGAWNPMPPDRAEWNPTGGATDVIHFKVTINPDDLPGDGNYTIDITASDSNRNAGKESITQIMVSYDALPPVAHIVLPELASGPDILNARQLKDIDAISGLLNGDLVIRWQIEDDVSVKKLRVVLYREDGGVAYDTDTDEDVQSILGYGSERNAQRNGEVAINADKLPASRTNLKVSTVVWDNAGNEDWDAHGWLVYEPAADLPWVELPTAPVISAIADYTYYPGGSFSAQAFDDDSVAIVETFIYAANPLDSHNFPNDPTLHITLSNSRDSRSFNWKIPALPSDTGNYKIAAVATDKNGRQGDEAVGYFNIVDISNPNVTVSSLSDSSPLFGDAAGNFTIAGVADDDADPVELKMAWIKPSSQATSQLSYMSSAYSGWDAASGSVDSEGNRIYDLPLDAAIPNGSGRMARNFSKPFNLFTDLGISVATPLKNQTFIFRVKDNSGKYLVKSWTAPGDSTPPSLSIEKAHVYDSAGSEKAGSPYTIDSNLILNAFESGDKVAVEGKWSDDSTDVWADKTKMGAFTVKWNGAALPTNASSLHADGVWITEKADALSGAIAVVTAQLQDLTGNAASAAANFMVTTSQAQLLRISSDKPDGVYNTGDIAIYLEFNQPVALSGSPVLSLNNGQTASYSGTSDNKKFYFTWTIPADHSGDTTAYDGGLLDATAMNGGQFAYNGAPVEVKRTNSNALNASKRIKIDTVKPSLTSLTAITGAGHYNAGNEIYLKAVFSEDIEVAGSPSLSLNSGASAKAAYERAMGSNSLMFKYTVSNGENASALAITAFSLNGAITDKGGNAFDAAIPNNGALDKTLAIDTAKPAPPSLAGSASEGGTHTTPPSFTLTGGEPDAVVEYSIDNGASWAAHTGAVTLNYNGVFNITARQTDKAGNASDKAPSVAVTIDLGDMLPLFSNITTNTVSGNYTTNQQIEIYLNLTRNIGGVNGKPYITVDAQTGGKTVPYTRSDSSNTRLVFTYTVESGDAANPLTVTGFSANGATFASGGTIDEIPSSVPSAQGLESYASLTIDTNSLLFQNMAFDANDPAGPYLVLAFNKAIYKGSGNITISQSAANYRAPAVMTKERYNELAGRASGLSAYYDYTTNGTDSSGKADSTGKYVLKYTIEPDNGSLVGLLRNSASAHVVTMSVGSSYATLDNSGTTGKLKINLTGAYALEVKGANYEVAFNAGIVQDSFGNKNAFYNSTNESDSAKKSVYYPGVEKPVIRVEKGKETLVQIPNGSIIVEQSRWVKNPTITFDEPEDEDMNNWDYVKEYYATGLQEDFFSQTGNGWRTIALNSLGSNAKVGIEVNANNKTIYSTIKTTLTDNDNENEWVKTSINKVQSSSVVFYRISDNNVGTTWQGNIPDGCQEYIGTYIYFKKSALMLFTEWAELLYLSDTNYYQKVDSGTVVSQGTGAVKVTGYWVRKQTGSTATANTVGAVQAFYNVVVYLNTVIAEQPLTARLRIDCRTPGAIIKYGMDSNETSSIKQSVDGIPIATGITMPLTASTSYSAALPLGSDSKTNGFKYGIIATATNDGKTETAYEAAYRSVLIYNGRDADNDLGDKKPVQIWVRGGDSMSPGQNMTPGFPISWDENDRKGIRLMTRLNDSAVGKWYWVTWELTTAAYVHFIEGSTPDDVNSGYGYDAENGPLQWRWSKNAWTFLYDHFPLFPGENRRPTDMEGLQPGGDQEWGNSMGSR
ncbi:MAG: hypothetical protein LBK73_03160 [Treponema sp.]|jgi:hypothetical protein|nr:hypothetical protein [Treponema sp.]